MLLKLSDLHINDYTAIVNKLNRKKVVLGFDGFIDIIVKPIQSGHVGNNPDYFETLKSFGNYISSRHELSGSIELETIMEKIGGNVPNTAAAMKSLGARVVCIGALGYPERHPLFLETFEPEEMISVTDPGQCISFEFQDGKLMCALNKSINDMDWNIIKSRVPLEKLMDLYSMSDMLVFVNWSELPHAGQIWEGVYDEIFTKIPEGKWVLFDLSDCTRKSDEQIREGIKIIRKFAQKSRAILSLNENEGKSVSQALFGKALAGEAEGRRILEYTGASVVVFHHLDKTFSFTPDETYCFNNYLIKKPCISTGGGDNFNAGFCCGLLSGLSVPQSTVLGSLCGSYYVENAKCATFPGIYEYAGKLANGKML
ncbi:MAG TPA: carbohydrate kinase family protein [Clostridiaceae bacterium]|nr:carbohydrate kinase family protein [Clostridiaceae bacterium]